MKTKQFFSTAIFSIFYVIAGTNHFINPEFYLPLIPEWLPNHDFINIISGAIEIGIGLLIWYKAWRKIISIITILMLLAFIPAHIHFILAGSCLGELCVHPIIGWIRLFVIHPLLIYWAWKVGKF